MKTPNLFLLNNLKWSFALIALMSVTLGFSTYAQDSEINEEESADNEILTLSDFEIIEDQSIGYQGKTSISALKFEIPLADIPLNMSVMTREAINDFNPTDNRQAEQLASPAAGGRFWSVIRGVPIGRKRKDGHPFTQLVHSDAIQRIEILKGPAGILYGQTSPGGIINMVKKRPIPGNDFANFTFGGGTHGRYKTAIDFNQTLDTEIFAGPVTYRVNLSYVENGNPLVQGPKFGYSKDILAHIPITFTPFKDTKITLGYEYYKRNFGTRTSTALVAGAITNGGIPISEEFGIDPLTDFGGGYKWETQTTDISVDVDQRIGDRLKLRFSYNHNEDIDGAFPNMFGFFSRRDPNNPSAPGDEPAVVRGFSRVWAPRQLDSLIVSGKYSFDAWNASHNLLFGYQLFDSEEEAFTLVGATSTNDDPAQDVIFFLQEDTPAGIPTNLAFPRRPARTINEQQVNNYFVNYFGKYADGRVNVLAGIGYFDSDSSTTNTGSGTLTIVNPDGEWTPQIGAIFKVTPNIGIYGMYTTSFESTKRLDAFGNPFSPTSADGFEAGVKLDFGDSLFATIGYYNITIDDVVTFDQTADTPACQEFEIDNPGIPCPISLLGGAVQSGRSRAEGFEAEFSGQFGGFTGQFGYAYTTVEVTDDPDSSKIGNIPDDTTPHRITLTGKYSVREGSLAGLSFGSNFNYFSDRYQANVEGNLPAYGILGVFAAYQFNWGENKVRLQVNGNNLTETKQFNTFGANNPNTGKPNPTSLGEAYWWFDVTFLF